MVTNRGEGKDKRRGKGGQGKGDREEREERKGEGVMENVDDQWTNRGGVSQT